jgi:ParB/RepB/Spo0J family partition protein
MAKKDFVAVLKEETGQAAKEMREQEASYHFGNASPAPAERTKMVGLGLIRPMARNPRGEVGDVTELASSIKSQGVVVPLLVRLLGPQDGGDDRVSYEVVSGHRRLKAAKEAGLDAVPCDVREMNEVQALELNLTEQINRKDLTPLEEGSACRSLQEISGYTVGQVAQRLGQSPSWVVRRLTLCDLAPEVQDALTKGVLRLTVAQAIAALPAQALQVKAFQRVAKAWGAGAESDFTVDLDLQVIRDEICRPLKGSAWKLTDELLVPEAGACSVCPHNSANAKMPGLFDSGKAAPQCANPSCYDDKARAVWAKKSEKAKEDGAKILPVAEGKKLFASGALPYSSRYVEASAVVQEDRQKRSWRQLVDEIPVDADGRPQLHVAQDAAGGVRELYVRDRALDAIAEHLGLKWAVKASEKADEVATRKSPEKQKEDEEARAIRDAVQAEVVGAVAKKYLKEGLDLRGARLLAGPDDYHLEKFGEATGKKVSAEWLQKKAGIQELLALAWFSSANWGTWTGFDEQFLELAKAHGFDVEGMARARIGVKK